MFIKELVYCIILAEYNSLNTAMHIPELRDLLPTLQQRQRCPPGKRGVYGTELNMNFK